MLEQISTLRRFCDSPQKNCDGANQLRDELIRMLLPALRTQHAGTAPRTMRVLFAAFNALPSVGQAQEFRRETWRRPRRVLQSHGI